jgi:hypothetical protein
LGPPEFIRGLELALAVAVGLAVGLAVAGGLAVAVVEGSDVAEALPLVPLP